MDPRPLGFIARACGGELLRGSPETCIARVCTDSRLLRPGDLFAAIAGERFDGHDFLAGAGQKAAAVLVERRRATDAPAATAAIVVENTRHALGALAAEYRRQLSLPMVVVGGSNGKTTTKDLIASVLRQKLATVSSEASFNNEIGVPLTLLRLGQADEVAVLEAGTNHPGELPPLLRMIRPQYGVITSIGREHLEFFGDLAGVAREEGWVGELLPETGVLFLNGDTQWTEAIVSRVRARVVRLGLQEGNDWRLVNPRLEKTGTTFELKSPWSGFSGEYRLRLLGRHQALNALFAIALGAELGLSREQVQHGLASCSPAKWRMEFSELNGVRLLDDSYNANADSMVAALETLQALPCKGRRVAILGDMAELGSYSQPAHQEIGRRAAELGVGQLFAVGKWAAEIARGARAGGLTRVLEFNDVLSAANAVKQFVRSGDLVLLKASRATRIERIGELLRGGNPAAKA